MKQNRNVMENLLYDLNKIITEEGPLNSTLIKDLIQKYSNINTSEYFTKTINNLFIEEITEIEVYEIILDKNLKIISFSDGLPVSFDLDVSQKELDDLSIFSFSFTKEQKERILEISKIVFEGRKYFDVIKAGIPNRFFETIWIPIVDSENRVSRISVLLRDISKLVELESKLIENETKFRQIAENTSDLIWTVDKNLRYNYVSPSIFKQRGYAVEEFMNLELEEVYTPDSLEKIKWIYHEFKSNYENGIKPERTSIIMELVHKCKDGSTITGEVHVNALFDNENKIIGFQGVTRNIEDRIRAQKELIKREKEYHQLFENLTDVFYKIKLDGTIINVSPSLFRISGYLAKEVIGTNALNFYENTSRRDDLIRTIVEMGQVTDFEIVMYDKYMNIRYVSINAQLVFDEDSCENFIIGVMHDITEKVQSHNTTEYHSKIQSLLLKISEDLLRSDSNNLNTTLLNSLKSLGEFFNVDRTYIYSLDSLNFMVSNSHEWCREGVMSIRNDLNDLSFRNLPNWTTIITNHQVLYFKSDENLADDWKAEKEYLDKRNIKSILVLPILFNDELIGVVGYDSVLIPRNWTEAEIQMLNVFCNQLSGILVLHKALISLYESENRYETFINATTDLVFLKDENGKYIFSNNENAALFNLNAESIIGKSDKELMTSDFLENCQRSDNLALISNEIIITEEIIGNRIFEVRKFPVKIHSNKYGIGGYIRDITDKKQNETKLLNHTIWLTNLNELSLQLASVAYEDIFQLVTKSLKDVLGVKYVWITLYNEDRKSIVMQESAMSSREFTLIKSIFGGKLPEFAVKLSDWNYNWLVQNIVYDFNSIHEATFGLYPETITNLIQSALKIGWISGVSLVINNKLIGGIGLAGFQNQKRLNSEDLRLLSGLVANAIIRKEAEQVLKENERKMSNLMNNIPGLIFRRKFDKNWTMEFLSSAFTELTGYEISEILLNKSLSFTNLIHPDYLQKIKRTIDSSLLKNSGYSIEYQLIKKDKSCIWVQEHSSFVYDKNGKPIGVEGVITNINDLKIAHQNVATHKNRLANLIKTMPDLLFLIDLNGRFLEFYAGENSYLMMSEENILKSTIFDVFTESEAQKHLEYIRYAHEFNETVSYDYSIENEGKKIYFEARATKNDEQSVLCIVRDITEKRTAEETIRKLLIGIEQSASSVVITDKEGNIEYVNSFFSYISGYTFDEIKGKNPRILKSGKTKPEVYTELWKTLQKGEDWHGEFLNKTKNGEEYWETATISPIKDNYGEIVNYIAVKSDITLEKKMLEELTLTKEKAEESDNLKSAFLRNISHEIRTPMNAIMGFTELMENNTCTPEQITTYFRIVSESGNNLLSVIENILIMSSLVTGQDKVNLEDFDLNELLKSVFDDYYSIANKKNLEFKFNTFVNDFRFIVRLDKNKILIILNQLISNAIKFTENGFVYFGYEVLESEIRFFVVDSGRGIPENKENEIFGQFRQLDNELTKEFGGMGLGLTISKKLIDMLGGYIWFESDGITGTKFYFSLPNSTNEKLNIITQKFPKMENKKEITILVAEDEYFNYLLIEHILTSLGMKVIHTENGQQAVEACKSNPEIDLVIMDIKMPIMDGYTATRLIKADRPEMIIIAQTAYALIGDKEKALSNGCDDYISKPISQSKLVEILVKYIHLPSID